MIVIILGTRPEIIKMSPVLRELRRQKLPFRLVHSGQHYSESLDKVFFRELKLRPPHIQLHGGSGTHAEQTAKIMIQFEKVCMKLKPSVILVHGDTNTTLAGAIVAKKLQIPLAHVEAGLRSHDDSMPEEINRKLVDRVSNFLFPPTVEARSNLLREGVKKNMILMTGNTVVDALLQNIAIAYKKHMILPKEKYIFLTAHRPQNVDSKKNFTLLVSTVKAVSESLNAKVIWPMHPRTEVVFKKNRIVLPKTFTILPPIGYLETLRYIKEASMVLTDSGGVQEEAYLLKRPLLTLRDNTERPETLTANRLVGLSATKAVRALSFFKNHKARWTSKLGKGDAARQIVKYLKKMRLA